MRPPIGRSPLVVAALAPASLVLVHNLVFLAAYGAQFQVVLTATGHDGRWEATVTVVAVLSANLGGVGLARLGFLWLKARSLGRARGHRPVVDVRAYLRVLAPLWLRLSLVTAALYLGQENLEGAAIGQPLPGLEPLLSGWSVPPLAVLASVTLLLAALGALFLWGDEALVARIAAALRRGRRAEAPVARRPPSAPSRAIASLLSLNLGRRAPPGVLFA
jgi:hypothetical protein